MNIENFIQELKKIEIEVTEKQLEQLDVYFQFLTSENKKYNLTAIIEREQVYLKHFYDSLTLNKIVNLTKISTFCDIGTGAGFPGIVIKIFFPHIKLTLIESLTKRCEFLTKLVNLLNLKNVEIINSRAEDLTLKEEFDVVTSRAVAQTSILLEYSIPLLKISGKFVAMKGEFLEQLNINNIEKELNVQFCETIEFELPIEKSKRTLISFVKKDKTSLKYPRNYSIMKKKPL